ncbi:MAG: hypothetical protein GY950_14955, partial [bacterium]|nr:hypothetical protein [bacterium]
MDFTLTIYKKLLETLRAAGYTFLRPENYFRAGHPPAGRFVILRHDVDRRPGFARQMAAIESRMGIYAGYYFRIKKKNFDESVIKNIAALGHEIGYHYEDLIRAKGNRKEALRLFEIHLKTLRTFYPVKTICMHGSPLSRWDSLTMWQEDNDHYKNFGIIGEPYLDIDFKEVLYLTDTGRSWDNRKMSVRDRRESSIGHPYKSTGDIIAAAANGKLPAGMMINCHPERWTDSLPSWLRQYLL